MLSVFCPLGRVAAWVVSGGWAQLGLLAISGRFKAAAPQGRCGIVTAPAEWYLELDLMFPIVP